MVSKKSVSILKKFLVCNFLVFSNLGLFTIIYLKAVQPNLVKKRSENHFTIIKNTNDHLTRLGIQFENESINKFLLSTRFLFQSLDRVRFYSKDGNLIADTNILDLDQSVFRRSDQIIEENIGENKTKESLKETKLEKKNKNIIKNYITKEFQGKPIVFEDFNNNSFFINTLNAVTETEDRVGFIVVTEEANDILVAVKERKYFVIRTVLAVALVILIFSLFLNKYILKPIDLLVKFTESIKGKSNSKIDIKRLIVRSDEVGKLTKSIDEMTSELQKRANRAETFSTDLTHEIRNPLASLKGASEILDKTSDVSEREKLLKIIDHDVERIERLITDYSQMLKDEASLSREKMNKVDLSEVIKTVTEDFKQDIFNQNKKVSIISNIENLNGKNFYVLGIENRLEQVIANLLDNAVSFSSNNQKIEIELTDSEKYYSMLIKDQGPGFNEGSTDKIFKRFYSNRPGSFGEHSGLGLNIVKNIIELHKGKITASNRKNLKGAQIEVLLPKLSTIVA